MSSFADLARAKSSEKGSKTGAFSNETLEGPSVVCGRGDRLRSRVVRGLAWSFQAQLLHQQVRFAARDGTCASRHARTGPLLECPRLKPRFQMATFGSELPGARGAGSSVRRRSPSRVSRMAQPSGSRRVSSCTPLLALPCR